MSAQDSVINVIDLHKSFGRTEVLRGLNLSVRAGEVYGYLGPNGAGKTTTISCLLDFIRPTSGSVSVLGQPVRSAGVRIRRQVGYVPADPQLYPTLTGHGHIALYRALSLPMHGAVALADRLDLNLSVKAKALSTGNQQKLALVLALAAEPQLLILDEPTRGLDPLVQDQIYQELAQVRAAGRTIFISSHNLAEVQKICDRVGVIKAGKLVADRSLAEVMKSALHDVRITFAEPYDLALFRGPHVHIQTHSPTTLELQLRGDINLLLAEIRRYKLRDLIITHASLEDIFSDYYREDRS